VPNKSRDSVLMAMGNGAVAGLAGTVVMTAFQRLVEMPATGRKESYAPADLVMKLFPVAPKRKRDRRRLNNIAHFGVGVAWGVGHGLIATRAGLRGQRAVATVFGAIWGRRRPRKHPRWASQSHGNGRARTSRSTSSTSLSSPKRQASSSTASEPTPKNANRRRQPRHPSASHDEPNEPRRCRDTVVDERQPLDAARACDPNRRAAKVRPWLRPARVLLALALSGPCGTPQRGWTPPRSPA